MKYCAELTTQIANLLEEGNNRTDSCVLVNISYETFTVWMQKPEFSEAIKKAEAKCKQTFIGVIKKASEKTWQAAAWWLERKHADEFGLKNKFDDRKHDDDALRLATKTIELMKHLNAHGITEQARA